MFLANYGDGLSNLALPEMFDFFAARDAVACFVGVCPTSSFHLVETGDSGQVKSIRHVKDIGMRVNGGFFILRRQIFDYLRDGEELVEEPFQRLAAEGKLLVYPFDGFWACMDTFKERQLLEDIYSRGQPPWETWRKERVRLGVSLE
jgi:glucose-1-phosphate cytidylyltransferase